MEIIRPIQCRGCGANGKAAWDIQSWNNGVHPTSPPLSVSGDFYLHGSRPARRLACGRCHQFFTPG